jgi:hypothetical protein
VQIFQNGQLFSTGVPTYAAQFGYRGPGWNGQVANNPPAPSPGPSPQPPAPTPLQVYGIQSVYYSNGGGLLQPMNLSGSGFSSITQIVWTCVYQAGQSCGAGTYVWTPSNWSGKFVRTSDTLATVSPSLLLATDPPGIYLWKVSFIGNGQQTLAFQVSNSGGTVPAPVQQQQYTPISPPPSGAPSTGDMSGSTPQQTPVNSPSQTKNPPTSGSAILSPVNALLGNNRTGFMYHITANYFAHGPGPMSDPTAYFSGKLHLGVDLEFLETNVVTSTQTSPVYAPVSGTIVYYHTEGNVPAQEFIVLLGNDGRSYVIGHVRCTICRAGGVADGDSYPISATVSVLQGSPIGIAELSHVHLGIYIGSMIDANGKLESSFLGGAWGDTHYMEGDQGDLLRTESNAQALGWVNPLPGG